VLLHHGTERPFCGVFVHQKVPGIYGCRLCGLPLFRATEKFDSGTGWPSFAAPFDPDNLKYVHDRSHGMVRTEIRCARCDSHRATCFRQPATHWQRFCINLSAAVHAGRPARPARPGRLSTRPAVPLRCHALAAAWWSSRVAPDVLIQPTSQAGRAGPATMIREHPRPGRCNGILAAVMQAIRGVEVFRLDGKQRRWCCSSLPTRYPCRGRPKNWKGMCSSPMTTAGASQRSTRGSQARQASERRRRSSCERATTSSCTPRTTCCPCRSTGTSGTAPWRLPGRPARFWSPANPLAPFMLRR
jgi:peptide-methionine (R)-S-oxide reductase